MLPFRVPRRAVDGFALGNPQPWPCVQPLPKSPKLIDLQVLWATHLSTPKGRNPRSDWRKESGQKSFSDSTNKPLKNQG
jgi:hypothetical protein